MSANAAPTAVAPARTGVITGAPTWHELFANAQHLFTEPVVEFGVLTASLFTSADSPDALLAKVEALARLSPVVIAMISDEEPERITLLKNPRRFNGSISTPCPIDGLLYGFTGSDARNLAAVHIPPAAFESSGPYNVLNDAAAIRAGLDTLPQDQLYHSYVVAGTPDMTTSSCKRSIVLPTPWYVEICEHFPDGIGIRAFYDRFLANVTGSDRQALEEVFTWWRHAASRSGGGTSRGRSGLQVPTQQALTPGTRVRREAWARTEVEVMLEPLRAVAPPLSNATFEAAFRRLQDDLHAQHNAREAREAAQHAEHEAREDRRDAEQTFEKRFGAPKLEEVLRMLDLASADDLPRVLRELGKNKKKADDTWILQAAIDQRATAPACVADEFTKPQLSTHIVDKFRSYTWAATGDELTDGITPFNIVFMLEPGARSMAAKLDRLKAVEAGGTAMSYSDADLFLKSDTHFPADTTACAYRLASHSLLVDIMLGEHNAFAVTYRHCVQALQSHLQLSLRLHYGEEAYMIGLRIMYWLTQQFLYYLSQRKLGHSPALPPFDMLLQHTQTKTLDGFLGRLLASWLEPVKPTEPKSSGPSGGGNTSNRANVDKGSRVTNTNWNPSIKKRWEAANIVSLNKMLEAKDPNATAPLPKLSNKEACLSWLIKGRCFNNCQHAATHKQAGAAVVTAVHTLLDACGVPTSN